jgi:hypothetical protein
MSASLGIEGVCDEVMAAGIVVEDYRGGKDVIAVGMTTPENGEDGGRSIWVGMGPDFPQKPGHAGDLGAMGVSDRVACHLGKVGDNWVRSKRICMSIAQTSRETTG